MNEPILSIRDLKVNYGGIEAVKGISFDVQEGSIVTLIGANGAGKSSTLRSIVGLVKPAAGEILFRGDDITNHDTNVIVKKGITLVPEGRRIFPDLTVLENLKMGAYLRNDDISGDLAWMFDLFPRLKERSWQPGGTLSGGEQQMLAVARALMGKPKLIMMDEPSLGLAPLIVRGIFDIIREINQQGVTVLLIEQNANMALKIADYAYVLETGRIGLSGTGKELVARVKAVLRRFQNTAVQREEEPETVAKPAKLVEYPDLIINLTNYSVTYRGENIEMPPKELELLYFLASSPNQVFTREQLLDNIWGYEYIGDTRTVDVHIKRLREKVNGNGNWAIATVWGIGYKFEVKRG